MAYSRRFARSKLHMVKRQLGQLIGHFPPDLVNHRAAAIHETFELCMIQGDAFPLNKHDKLSTIVKRTGSWQHLVKSDGKPIAIAHSAAPGSLENEWSVQSFFVSPIAAKIASAVERIDRMRPSKDVEVTLVTVPSKDIDFFLLRSPKKTEVYLIARRGRSEGRFYTEKSFLKMLSSTPEIVGFGTGSPKNLAQNTEHEKDRDKLSK